MSNSSLPALLYCCRLQHVHINNETRTKHIYKLEVGKSNLCAFNVLTGGTIRAQECQKLLQEGDMKVHNCLLARDL